MKKIPELLAPAGTLDGLKTAILYGADAVYAGIPGFSMRARAKITVDEMKQGIEFAHKHGKKVYLAFNLFAHDNDYKLLPQVSETINKLSPDALIVADPGVLTWVQQHHPKIPIHISTQANICSADTVKFWQNAGASLCVLAREVTHPEFKQIREKCPDIGLEIFIHGAMCMSYSGRCLMSNFVTGRPANRGACAQLCRWKYDIVLREKESGLEMGLEEDDRGAYIMNSKDLCLMPRLRDVLESGADSLKIEGRNRSEYYVGTVVRAYRNAIDAWAHDPENFDSEIFMKDLNVLETRGYTTAFFDGKLGPSAHDYETTRSDSDYHAAGVITNVTDDYFVMELRNEIKQGDKINFILPHTMEKVIVVLDKIINDKNGDELLKMSAGQNNSLRIEKSKIDKKYLDKFEPLVLAYKNK
ncbi:MAG: U32 family peptidase [Alphaproteobacteria bacterium]|nr:U32 family peptidase [Alphaproteobacteria bacterium]MBN2675455.1 U32 family peptidase [Alphaproteobacteria bacterium]